MTKDELIYAAINTPVTEETLREYRRWKTEAEKEFARREESQRVTPELLARQYGKG